jgi:hypothetical protein
MVAKWLGAVIVVASGIRLRRLFCFGRTPRAGNARAVSSRMRHSIAQQGDDKKTSVQRLGSVNIGVVKDFGKVTIRGQ